MMMACARVVALMISVSLAFPAATARADPSVEDRALAASLFKEGKALMPDDTADPVEARRKALAACPKFEESQRLDPSSGTILNLASCYEKIGRLASAWTTYADAVVFAKRDGRADRIAFAKERIAAIEPILSRLVVVVPVEADVPSLEIRCDGRPLRRPSWGHAMPVDPGGHVVEASAPGKRTIRRMVSVGTSSDVQTLTIDRLVDVPMQQDAPTSAAASTSSAFVLGGAGVAWLGVGTYLGLRALSKRRESDVECAGTRGCTSRGVSLNDQARTFADASTASFAIGLAGMGVSAYLFLSSRSAPALAAPATGIERGRTRLTMTIVPNAGFSHAGLALVGAF